MPRKLRKFEGAAEKAARTEVPAAARKEPIFTRAEAERRMAEHTRREQEAAAADAAKVKELETGLDVEAMAEHEEALKELRAKRTARRQAKAEAKAEEIAMLKAVRKATAKERLKAGITAKDIDEIGERQKLIEEVEAEGKPLVEDVGESKMAPEEVMARRGMERERERYLKAKAEREPEITIAEASPEEQEEILHAEQMEKLEAYQAEKSAEHQRKAAEFNALEEKIKQQWGHYPEAIDLNPSLAKMPEGTGLFKRMGGWFRNLAGQPADLELASLMDEWRGLSAEVLELSREAGVAKPSFEAEERIERRRELTAREREVAKHGERWEAAGYRAEKGMKPLHKVRTGTPEAAERAFFGEELEPMKAEEERQVAERMNRLGKRAADLQAVLSREKGISAERLRSLDGELKRVGRQFYALPETGSEDYNDNRATIREMLMSAGRLLTAEREEAETPEIAEKKAEAPRILEKEEFQSKYKKEIAEAPQYVSAHELWNRVNREVEQIKDMEELEALEAELGTKDAATAYVLKAAELQKALHSPVGWDRDAIDRMKAGLRRWNEQLGLPEEFGVEREPKAYTAAVSETGEPMETVELEAEFAQEGKKQKKRSQHKAA